MFTIPIIEDRTIIHTVFIQKYINVFSPNAKVKQLYKNKGIIDKMPISKPLFLNPNVDTNEIIIDDKPHIIILIVFSIDRSKSYLYTIWLAQYDNKATDIKDDKTDLMINFNKILFCIIKTPLIFNKEYSRELIIIT